MRVPVLACLFAACSVLAGCGPTTETRAATGALGGLAVGGPVGAAVGAGAGVVYDRVQ